MFGFPYNQNEYKVEMSNIMLEKLLQIIVNVAGALINNDLYSTLVRFSKFQLLCSYRSVSAYMYKDCRSTLAMDWLEATPTVYSMFR